MAQQLDWVQKQAEKHERLETLQGIIQHMLNIDAPCSEPCIRITLMLIRQYHGDEAEAQTKEMFNIKESQDQAA